MKDKTLGPAASLCSREGTKREVQHCTVTDTVSLTCSLRRAVVESASQIRTRRHGGLFPLRGSLLPRCESLWGCGAEGCGARPILVLSRKPIVSVCRCITLWCFSRIVPLNGPRPFKDRRVRGELRWGKSNRMRNHHQKLQKGCGTLWLELTSFHLLSPPGLTYSEIIIRVIFWLFLLFSSQGIINPPGTH